MPYLGMKLAHWPKFTRSCTYNLYPRGLKLSLFMLYRQRFQRYRLIFKIALFRHETSSLTKDPDVAHIPSFYPKGVIIELIFALLAEVYKIWADFQNCHIWAWNLAIGQTSRSCTCTIFLPKGAKIDLTPVFLIYGQRFEIWVDLKKLPYLGIKLIVPKLHRYPLNYPPSPKFHSVLLYGT